MMLPKVFVLFVSTFVINVNAGETYVSGTTKVDVETTILDEYNSTRKCVTYHSNPPEKYESACFSTMFTDQGTFKGCTVQFDNNAQRRCDDCSACTDFDEQIGFQIDCDSIIPSKSNLDDVVSCTVLNDANIQELLTDDLTTTFANTPFNFFVDPTSVTDDNDANTNTNTGNKTKATSGGDAATQWTSSFVIFVMVFTLAVR